MNSFGLNLKKERQRLGLNQDDFAAVGGVKKRAQISYEQDERFPDAAYLRAIAAIGVDVLYILIGQATTSTLTTEETALLAGFRNLDIGGKISVTSMISALQTAKSQPSPTREKREQQRQKTLQETMGLLDDHIAKQEAGKAKKITKKSA